ncbi:SDR family oxidoreductase [Diaphorobacter ruginosibacter]|uniref:SDR family oxidoreductase n=1 Tax=Diaphorobacter ruginosibacter TaxID=1715720 RepID=UPI00334284AD
MIENFAGKTAVLTGAASGFGLECARIGARLGMRLVLVDVQADALAQAEAEMRSLGAQVLARRVDVSSADEMDALSAEVLARFGAPHLVFNNAGVGAAGLIWEASAREWDWVLGVNLRGVAHGVRVFTPMMLEAARRDAAWRGHIVNTASMAGLVVTPNLGVYNVSKHAVVALSETLYQDLQLVTSQIGASVLCPYFVPTGIGRSERNRPDALNGLSATRSQEVGAQMLDKAVAGGKVTAGEVAAKVFDAVAANQFYIYSHPQAIGAVQARMEDILRARNPGDPFAARPQLREQLQEQLRVAPPPREAA